MHVIDIKVPMATNVTHLVENYLLNSFSLSFVVCFKLAHECLHAYVEYFLQMHSTPPPVLRPMIWRNADQTATIGPMVQHPGTGRYNKKNGKKQQKKKQMFFPTKRTYGHVHTG